MKALRFVRALPLVSLLFASQAMAAQGTIVGPTVGPHTMADVMGTINAAFLAIQGCNSGSSSPTNGPSSAPVSFEMWCDTTTNPVVVKMYDGASWVVVGKLDTSSHIWTPEYQGTDLGTASIATTGTSGHTLGFLDGINTVSALWTFSSGKLAATSPAFTTPSLGVATATSINKVAITQPATGSTLTIPDGVTMTGPTVSGTVMTLGNAEAVSGVKTFGTSKLVINGGAATAGLVTVNSSGVVTSEANATVAQGGTGGASASGTLLDNITAFSATGFLTRTGAGTYAFQSLTNGITNSNLAQAAAYTLKANNSGSTGNVSDMDVTALTSKPAPISGDIVLIQDSAASNAFKKTTVGALSSAGSVASIAGNTGAFTLGGLLNNVANLLQVTAASKSDQQTATGATVAVTPAHQQEHESAIQYKCLFNGTTTGAARACDFYGYGPPSNAPTIQRTSTGIYVITFPANWSSASSYVCWGTLMNNTSGANIIGGVGGQLVGSWTFELVNSGTLIDGNPIGIACSGKLA